MSRWTRKKEGTKVVQAYSFEIERRLLAGEERSVLNDALIQARDGDTPDIVANPWRVFYVPHDKDESLSSQPQEVVLSESSKLREKWLVFYRSTPENERVDLAFSEPTIEGVVQTVQSISAQWRLKKKLGRFGRAKELFHKLCGFLNSHSALIKLLPEGNEYVSIFTGTLNAIIKASANYQRVAESIGEGLVTVSEHIQNASRNMSLYEDIIMQTAVADLYQHIFLFLGDAMDWIMEKRHQRLLDSFKEDFNDRFDARMKSIHKKTDHIRDIADYLHRLDTKAVQDSIDKLMLRTEQDRRLDRDDAERDREDRKYHDKLLRMHLEKERQGRLHQSEQIRMLAKQVEMLGENARSLLEAGYQGAWHARNPSPTMSGFIEVQDDIQAICAQSQAGPHEAAEVAINSSHLEDFFSRDRVRLPLTDAAPANVGIETIAALTQWVQGNASGIVWLDGSITEAEDLENPLTVVAGEIIKLTEIAGLPVLSYFCQTVWQDQYDKPPEQIATVALLYSVIRQLVELMLPQFETSIDLSEERFSLLDGSLDTWNAGLAILKDLISLLPRTTFCIIDGLHWLDDQGTETALEQLVECLRNERLRTLFTTTGRSGCLMGGLEVEEIVPLEDLRLQDLSFSVENAIDGAFEETGS